MSGATGTASWGTPLAPVAPDEMWCVWHTPTVYEWICGQEKAEELLNGGMTRINGEPCIVEIVDRWPQLNGVHVRATVNRVRLS